MPQKLAFVLKDLTAMRTEDLLGQFVKELCVVLTKMMLQFMSFQSALAHKTFVTVLTFPQNLPVKCNTIIHISGRFIRILRHLDEAGTARTSSNISAMSSGKAKVVARSALVMKLYL